MIGRGLLLLMVTLVVAGCGSGGQVVPLKSATDQMEFGVAMAQRGLWSEALFRFERASTSQRDFEVLNNLAVASEALGRFDDALGYYKEALDLSPSNPDLRNNYNRFVSFYESFRVEDAEEEEGGSEGASEPESQEGAVGEGAIEESSAQAIPAQASSAQASSAQASPAQEGAEI